ncbi:hypothetical protein [Asticcacaulis endophyticus]|uniref:Uncharacterized protein n=1 Tax=Asticcacaulis endophyticus TaxID=1395890 RepID=A0A918Q3T8_9CAUL|nr:hypothetical protein [Asticcacaulis endophyticus]GGZ32886.1 hypothetical protein GCM10011273_18960 [Asticcacaulis endophyticus]
MDELSDRDFAMFLLSDLDLEAQLRAIHHALSWNRQADKALSDDINDLAQLATKASDAYGWHLQGQWQDSLHASIYQDAAHSMAAIGMLAPAIESLITTIFLGLETLDPSGRKITLSGERANHTRDKRAWDPHYIFGKSAKRDVVRGTIQLADSIGLRSLLPADVRQVLEAVFTYRNRMLHLGFEWPVGERKKFSKLVETKRWPTEWFTQSTTDGEPWIIYMGDALISRALALIDEIMDGVGKYLKPLYS